MRNRQNGAVLRQLRTLCNLGTIGEATDGQLLERFCTDHGEAAELAFAALVERHGALVLRICRAVLRDEHDAQDAFQATFLVLVRKAHTLWVRNSLAPWLHQVACRAAGCTRAARARRRLHERRAAEMRWAEGTGTRDHDDFGRALHEEIARLPERYRVPLILCDLEGCTHERAAGHLACPVGTVKSRLTRGRERLRSRLVRRGLAPSAFTTGALMSAETARASVPIALSEAMVQAAWRVAAGRAAAAGAVPAPVAAVADDVLSGMLLTSATKVASAGLLTLLVVAIGTEALAPRPKPEAPGTEVRQVDAPDEERGAAPPPFLTLRGHKTAVWNAAFSPDGKTLASGSLGELKLWDAAMGRQRAGLEQGRSVRWIAFAPDGKTMATADHDGSARLRDAATGAVLRTFPAVNQSLIDSAAFSPDGTILATSCCDRTVRLWDVATGLAIGTLRRHEREVYHVAFSPDGRTIASASRDGTARLWSVASGELQRTLLGHERTVHNVAFSPDGKTVATASWDRTVRLWDAATGRALGILKGHTHQVLAVAFSPDGKTLASCSGRWGDDEYGPGPGQIKIWDAATHEELASVAAHSEQIFSVAYSPDGRTLASASFDRTVKLWDVATLLEGDRPRDPLVNKQVPSFLWLHESEARAGGGRDHERAPGNPPRNPD